MAETGGPGGSSPSEEALALVVERNIRTLIERRREEERQRTLEDRVSQAISRFSGRILSVYIHVAIFGLWIVVNLGWLGVEPFDPSFNTLSMIASVEAIFLSTFVLIKQNRLGSVADRRADLDLQIGLLAEHEITRLIQMVSAIADALHVELARSPELSELKRDVAPEQVLDRIEQSEREVEGTQRAKSQDKADGTPDR